MICIGETWIILQVKQKSGELIININKESDDNDIYLESDDIERILTPSHQRLFPSSFLYIVVKGKTIMLYMS